LTTNRIVVALVFLAIFASANTILAIYFQFQSSAGPACSTTPCVTRTSTISLYQVLSVPFSVGSWFAFGLTAAFWKRGSSNSIRSSMIRAGFDRKVYDLMVKMRGSGSRLSILQTLTEAPRYRNELSQITGIDWKEVDRQVGLLERFGFVSVETKAGPVKMYKLTEQGILLVKLMDEMGKSRSV
jgi:DNA-binding HxlR family transcriptional regulator